MDALGCDSFSTLASVNEYAKLLTESAARGVAFNDNHAAVVVESLVRALEGSKLADELDADRLMNFIKERAHLKPKHWPTVKEGLDLLRNIIGEPGMDLFETAFSRILRGGRWHEAEQYGRTHNCSQGNKPWVVLVMGCNGIRKTTSVFQSWFKSALAFSLGGMYTGRVEDLPDGNNSFFRQLDFMMANMVNSEFSRMYKSECCKQSSALHVDAYTALKGGIFARYRGICEMLGGILLESAIKRRMNVMVETSGKDIASLHYVNFFFPDSEYRKLVVYFDIDDVKFAEASVDARMQTEMQNGSSLMSQDNPTLGEIMEVNCGGPYGGNKLRSVEALARSTWSKVTQNSPSNTLDKETASDDSKAWSSWHFARVEINGSADPDQWTARGVGVLDGSGGRRGEVYKEFLRPCESQTEGSNARPIKRMRK